MRGDSCLGLPTKGNSRLLLRRGTSQQSRDTNVTRPTSRDCQRRSTSQHKSRDTNAGGGVCRRNTSRVTPTPRRSTSQHKSCDTNAGGGVCRRNTSRVTPTPRRRSMSSQHKSRDTNAGGGVRRNTSHVTPTPEEEYVVATQVA